MEALSCPHFVDNSGHYYNISEKEKRMKQVKTSIRFFNKVAVRARWDEETLSRWYSATDIIQTLGTVELVELCINAMCLHSVLSI